MDTQYVVFDLGGEHYGVDIAAVEGIIKLQAITSVPHAPAFIEGVTNLRGKVLPVIDLRRRFKLPAEAPSKETRIAVVEMRGTTIGMIVDGVSQVLRVPEEAIEPPSPIVMTIDSAFIRGIAKVGDRLIIVLDLSQILQATEQLSLEQDLQLA
jgi:purine-binding chemotaxis protein CheW